MANEISMSKSIKISKNPKVNWANNAIQFPRLITELQVAGAFTSPVVVNLLESMDLTANEVFEIVDRADKVWEEIKKQT